ncbi:MAG TPA: F0F1 ATP synthase subunit B [Chloroflexota bacterium]|nr:F0F1 ATP synthase subunit B [Chloroflexota bacterium]
MLANNFVLWWIAQVAAIAILVYFFLFHHFGFLNGGTIWGLLQKSLQSRRDGIQHQLEAAQRSREEAQRLHEEALQDVEEARHEAASIVERAGQTSQAIQADLEARAREEYNRILDQARSQIQYEQERAVMALQRRAADIVVDAAREVVERNLEPQTDRAIIDTSLDQLQGLR